MGNEPMNLYVYLVAINFEYYTHHQAMFTLIVY